MPKQTSGKKSSTSDSESSAENSGASQNNETFSQKVKKYSRYAGVAAGCAVVFVILVIGIALGGIFVPRVQSWLEDHNFIDTSESADSKDTQKDVKRTVVNEENMVTDVVEKVKDGVVSIAVSEATLDENNTTVENSVNIGTGFIIDESGLIMTNQHVVSVQNEDYIVVTSDGKEYPVQEVQRDDLNDLAILKVDAKKLKALDLGNSDDLEVGQYLVAIGTPLGDYPGSVTTGVVSGLGRSVTAGSGFWGTTRTYEDVIQTDAAVNPGNSGGPLLDMDGSVIGINFATTSGADNISFALPINRAKQKISEYKKYGKFIKPYLGVEYQIISERAAKFYRGVVAGALVNNVLDDSPAQKAGIKKGDIIVKIDNKEVGNSLSILIQQFKVDEEVEVELWRNGETIRKTVTLEEAE